MLRVGKNNTGLRFLLDGKSIEPDSETAIIEQLISFLVVTAETKPDQLTIEGRGNVGN